MGLIRYGIVGVGAVTRRAHIPVLSLMEDVEIVALCNPSREGAEQGASLCRKRPILLEDYRELLARPDVDAVVIASPSFTHKQFTLDALAAGKHVLCEKPMAISEDECRAVREAAGKARTVLQYGMELRYGDLYRKVAELIHGGQIGRLRMLFCREFRWPMLGGSHGWRNDPALTGGTLLEKNCHHFDLFNWFAASEPVLVTAIGGNDVNPAGDIDNAWVTVEYANGVRACLGLCLFSPYGNDLEVTAVGDQGKVESFASDQVINQWGAKRADKTVHHLAFEPLFEDLLHENREKERSILWERSMIYREHRAFVDSIRSGKEPVANADVAFRSCTLPLAAQRAMQTGEVVRLRP